MERDVKGLYRKAMEGKISDMTGVQDPYEDPVDNEITVDTEHNSVDRCAAKILHYLVERNYLKMGLYRGTSVAQDGVIFHDGMTAATSLEDLTPPAAQASSTAPAPDPSGSVSLADPAAVPLEASGPTAGAQPLSPASSGSGGGCSSTGTGLASPAILWTLAGLLERARRRR